LDKRIENLKKVLEADNQRAIFLERLILLEEAFERYKDEPAGRRYALSFDHVLSNMTVNIKQSELIVGSINEVIPTEAEEKLFVEKAQENNFSPLELFSFDPLGLIEIKDPCPRYAPSWFNSWGHLTVSWETLLKKGFEGILSDIEEKLEENNASAQNCKSREVHNRIQFLQNAAIACKSMINLGKRYAAKALELYSIEADEHRKRELSIIADICSRVPAKPPASFYEALQSIWFTYMVLQCVCGARDYGLGRFDKYLFPFYKQDIERGKLDKTRALELLECFFIKLNEIIGMGVENFNAKRILSVNSLQYLIIGGINEKGQDVSNELSLLVFEAVGELRLKQPTVTVRYHRNINKSVFEKACETAKLGLGYPGFYNDDMVMSALKNLGVSERDAVNYVHYGCNNPNIPGKEDELREVWHNLPKYLELALNEGICMLTGRKIGMAAKPVHKINSFEDLLEAFRKQIRHGIKLAVEKVKQSDEIWAKLKPFSFESLLLENCMENGVDLTSKGAVQKHMNNHAVGMATLANSLYAIRKLVFDDNRLTLGDLREILKSNFKGSETLREEIKNKYPKFGNDDIDIDEIARRVGQIFCEEVMNTSPSSQTERKLWPSFYSLWHHRDMGKHTAATADGRISGEPLSESQSPVYDSERYGPTAVLNSVSKLPFEFTPGGGLNIKFQPGLFNTPNGTMTLAGLIKGYFYRGGLQIQINIMDRDILLDARKNPEKHKNLLVRVAGYSAYFVTLSPEQQEEIINRTTL